jgi:isopentenyl-diphosphate delta-isomerase
MSDITADPGAVIVLDEHGTARGAMDKLAAHRRPPTPHLAFSVMLFDGAGAVLLQRRAAGKYHFAGRWSNACCSHPRPGESVRQAARRRVREELGVDCDGLQVRGAFWYHANDPASDLAEHEYDVVLTGRLTGPVHPDPTEVGEVAVRDADEVLAACREHPGDYTPWLARVIEIARGPVREVAAGVAL